jgi:anti-sigma-K factor RskA
MFEGKPLQWLIDSGNVELYCLGALHPAEMAEFEALVAIHPELENEVRAFQNTIETMAIRSAVTPPSHLRALVLDSLDPYHETDSATQSTNRTARTPWWRYAAAACVGLAIGIAPSALYYQELQHTKGELAVKQQQVFAAQSLQRAAQRTSTSMASAMDIMAQARQIVMLPTANHNDTATAYYQQSTGNVVVRTTSLPKLANNQDYQLWAIVNGKPVDMGVVPSDSSSGFYAAVVPNNAPVQVFAITIEPKGGVPAPTLSAMVVAGAAG